MAYDIVDGKLQTISSEMEAVRAAEAAAAQAKRDAKQAEQAAMIADLKAAKERDAIAAMLTMTPAQIEMEVAKTNTFPELRALLGKLAALVIQLAKN